MLSPCCGGSAATGGSRTGWITARARRAAGTAAAFARAMAPRGWPPLPTPPLIWSKASRPPARPLLPAASLLTPRRPSLSSFPDPYLETALGRGRALLDVREPGVARLGALAGGTALLAFRASRHQSSLHQDDQELSPA